MSRKRNRRTKRKTRHGQIEEEESIHLEILGKVASRLVQMASRQGVASFRASGGGVCVGGGGGEGVV